MHFYVFVRNLYKSMITKYLNNWVKGVFKLMVRRLYTFQYTGIMYTYYNTKYKLLYILKNYSVSIKQGKTL